MDGMPCFFDYYSISMYIQVPTVFLACPVKYADDLQHVPFGLVIAEKFYRIPDLYEQLAVKSGKQFLSSANIAERDMGYCFSYSSHLMAGRSVNLPDQINLSNNAFADYYRNSELKDQLPAQIVMQAPRQALLDFKAGRTQSAQLDAVLRTQELF